MVTSVQRAYLAGIIDGDGGIYCVTKNRGGTPTIKVQINSTTLELMEWSVELMGGKFTERPEWTKSGDPTRIGTKPCYSWGITSERAAIVLRGIKPYLIVRRERAEETMDAWLASPKMMRRPGRRAFHTAQTREDMLTRGWPKSIVFGT